MWKFKTDWAGRPTVAVKKRLAKCAITSYISSVDLTSHVSRSRFGYCYLEWVDE